MKGRTATELHEDAALQARANAYAQHVVGNMDLDDLGARFIPAIVADVARAFVIGYAAALEHAAGVGRRTVKRSR